MKIKAVLTGCLLAGNLAVAAQSPVKEPAVVLPTGDQTDSLPEPLKRIEVGGDATAVCTYQDVLIGLRREADEAGANMVKITRRRERSRQHPCEQVEAALYSVPDPHRWETEFSWSRDRRLQWRDFRGTVPPDRKGTAAETACGIGFETNAVSGDGPVKVMVYNSFSTEDSWVRPGDATAEVLRHEQGHFDLCEIYTRRFRERLSRTRLSGNNMKSRLEAMYRDLQQEYLARQQLYEDETSHGLNREAQQQWLSLIAVELEENTRWSSTGTER